ncbi:MAG: hemerythrin family protein [Pseudomonadota bacterium]
MAIIWRDALSVGNAGVDTDHRYLLCLINTVELALRVEESSDALVPALKQLKLYTQEHFAREEKLMAALRYARIDQHRIAHGELIEQFDHAVEPVMKLRVEPSAAAAEAISDATREEIIAVLRHWLLDHIIKEDMLLKPLFAGIPRDYQP